MTIFKKERNAVLALEDGAFFVALLSEQNVRL